MGTIAAIFHRNAQRAVLSELQPMLAVSHARARDGEHVWCQGPAALARQHFWITPEEFGREQPVFNPAHTIALISSVRLDNRRDLGRLLLLDDRTMAEASDADLILCAYTQWGSDCFERLLGDFAVVIWDSAKQHLILVRDQLGAKGLCYYMTNDHVIVATEIGQLLAHPLVPRRLNERKVAAYMGNFWDGSAETFYEDILYCRPAEVIVISAEQMRQFTYWQPADRPIRYKHDDEYIEHFRDLVSTTVSDRLRVTGSIGISLSGGLDSTMVAALAARNDANPARIKTFSYVFDRFTECDERRYSCLVVEQYNLEASWLVADELWPLHGYPDAWPGHTDYIMADAYAHLPLAVYTAAREAGCRVVLNGHFGDLLYSGERYWAAGLLRHGQVWQLGREFRSATARRTLVKHDFLRMGVLAMLPQTAASVFRRVKPIQQTWSEEFGLNRAFIQRTQLNERYRYYHQHLSGGSRERVAREQSLLHASWGEGIPVAQSLYQTNGVTMWMPLFDRRLLEFVLNIPADQLGRPGCTRRIGRRAMHGILSDAVRMRQSKTTFESLNEIGLEKEAYSIVRELLTDSRIEALGYIDSSWLHPDMIDGMINDEEQRYRLWQWVSLEIWLRRYWNGIESQSTVSFSEFTHAPY